jgi:UDP-2-acetamido-3-amino-2,3-dideoxy-glucuronate N-acetyltransferase
MLAEFPGPRGVFTYEDAFSDDDVRGVAIATPAATHGELARAALLAGKDVYVEKPLCLSTREGRELVELARELGRVLMVGHLLWYHPVVLELARLIREGELGRVRYIYSNRLNMGKLRQEENVLWSFAPHDVSVILGLVGAVPESVQAQGGNFLHEQIADTTVSMLTFATGLRAHIFVSWLHPFKEQKLVVVGDRKMAVFNDTVGWEDKLHLYDHSVAWKDHAPVARKGEAQRVAVEPREPLRAECEHFIECIETRATPRTDGEEGLRVLEVLNACQRALQTGTLAPVGGESRERGYFVHDTAVVDPGVEIGAGTKIWHFSHLLAGTRIGRECTVGQNVMIGPDVAVGDGCKIQNNVSLYQGVELEQDVFVGPSAVFTNVDTPRAHVERKTEFLRTRLGRGATIGANATVVCGHDVGTYGFVGAGAVVTRHVPAHALVVGVPARRIGWVCTCARRLDDELRCPCGEERYRDVAGVLERLEEPAGEER